MGSITRGRWSEVSAQADLLFEQAKRRERRRRLSWLAASLLAAAAALGGAVSSSVANSRSSSSRGTLSFPTLTAKGSCPVSAGAGPKFPLRWNGLRQRSRSRSCRQCWRPFQRTHLPRYHRETWLVRPSDTLVRHARLQRPLRRRRQTHRSDRSDRGPARFDRHGTRSGALRVSGGPTANTKTAIERCPEAPGSPHPAVMRGGSRLPISAK